jgi:enoyl-CoA hydratase/carnithine racemase
VTSTSSGLIPTKVRTELTYDGQVARIGASRSAELIITAESWRAVSALSAGLVHRVAQAGELNSCLDAWIQTDFLVVAPMR